MNEKEQRSSTLSRSQAKNAGGKGPHRILRRMTSLLFSVIIFSAIALLAMLVYLRTQALPTAVIMQTSQILDVNGDIIDVYHSGQNRHVVSLQDISTYAIQATLSIEDHRFYEHYGLDFKGIARAAVVNLKHMDRRQGASTITQQLAQNLYLTHDRTWSIKAKETLYALQLEMQNSKDEILEKYLNQIYYGHATYGIQAAAELYFAKQAKELNLAESTLLAGVPKGPKYFSPYLNENNAKSRQKLVLDAMVRDGYITMQEAADAYAEPLNYKPLVGGNIAKAPYFRDYIRFIAVDKLGIEEKLLMEGGVKVFTTLDLRAQSIAEEVVDKYMDEGELQAALIAIDPRNGHIKAMIGGRDYEQNQFNRVFSTSRQPGSAFKPIVYLAGLQSRNLSAVTRFRSEPTVFTYDEGRKSYAPSNFGDKYPHEEIDLREAIRKSDNIYAVHTVMQVGPQNVIDLARELGIHRDMQPVPSLALGTFPVSPYEMASAFGTIANAGVKVEPTAILRIVGADGRTLYEAAPQEERVVDAASAYVLTNLMESVFDPGGTGNRIAQLMKRPVAGKTGTTNSDAWMVGFTPELSTAVWVGYDKGRTISKLESRIAAPIFAEFTERVLEPVPPKIFPIPDGVITLYIDPESGKLATEHCPEARRESFIQGSEPLEYCSLHGLPPTSSDDTPAVEEHRSWWEDLKRWWNE